MPLIALLIGALETAVGSLVGRCLLALGISFVSYTGMNTGIDWLQSQIQSNMSALPSTVSNFLAWLWVDKAIATLFSAYTAAAGIKMAGSNVFKKMVVK